MADTESTGNDAGGAAPRRCGNCGVELLGEHCHACGQPTRGLVRHFTSIVGDFFDSVFDLDSRTLRTLGPLLLRPGHLTLEYFEGRRVRYVSPVRLFFFLVVLAFLALRLATADGAAGFDVSVGDSGVRMQSSSDFDQLDTAEAVIAERARALAELAEAREQAGAVPGVSFGLDAAQRAVEGEAEARLAELAAQAADAAPADDPTAGAREDAVGDAGGDDADAASGVASGDESGDERGNHPDDTGDDAAAAADPDDADARDGERRRGGPSFNFNGTPWHPVDNPIDFASLPDWANSTLNGWLTRIDRNARRVRDEPDLLRQAFLENLPVALFVMLPLFALLLKLAYLFKRRLYMEHLIVALHSHAFLSFGLLLVALAMLARQGLGPGTAASALGWVEFALFLWMPLYLLVMQKRVYRQGWILTVLKYGALGTAYSVLLGFGTLLALAISLATL